MANVRGINSSFFMIGIYLVLCTDVIVSSGTSVRGRIQNRVVTNRSAIFAKGTKALLPCKYLGRPNTVVWTKGANIDEVQGLVYLNITSGQRGGDGFDSGSYNISDDLTLIIKHVTLTDEGRYFCQVSDLETGRKYWNHTDVSVYVLAGQPFIQIKECEKYILSEDGKRQCIYEVAENEKHFHLHCSVYGAKPKPSLYWMHGDGMQRNITDAVSYTEQPDGTYDVTAIMSWQTDIAGTIDVFYCIAEGLSINGTTNSSITVYYISDANIDEWLVFLPILIKFIGLLIFFVFIDIIFQKASIDTASVGTCTNEESFHHYIICMGFRGRKKVMKTDLVNWLDSTLQVDLSDDKLSDLIILVDEWREDSTHHIYELALTGQIEEMDWIDPDADKETKYCVIIRCNFNNENSFKSTLTIIESFSKKLQEKYERDSLVLIPKQFLEDNPFLDNTIKENLSKSIPEENIMALEQCRKLKDLDELHSAGHFILYKLFNM